MKKKKKERKERRGKKKRKEGEREFVVLSVGALGHWPRFKGKAIVSFPLSYSVNPLINHRRGEGGEGGEARLFESRDKSALGLKASSRNSLSPFPFWNSTECTFCLERRREGSFSLSLSPYPFVRGFVLIPPPSVSRRHASRVARGHLNHRSAKPRLKKKIKK